MNRPASLIRWKAVVVVVLVFAGLYLAGQHNLKIQTDIAAGMPQRDPVINEAHYIITQYPVFDRIVIDVGLTSRHPDSALLVSAATFLQQGLNGSGMFKEVGLENSEQAMPLLLSRVVSSLPFLFSSRQLETSVLPLLAAGAVSASIQRDMDDLQGLGGLGQTDLMAHDPLGFRNLVLARMASMLPVQNARIDDNFIMSQDRRHILIIADPRQSTTDSTFAFKVHALIQKLEDGLDRRLGRDRDKIRITPVGSYRAAIDNETIVRKDTMRALLLSTLGIALLLLISFPRWYIGIMALIPALAGTALALFVMSLLKHDISILAIGFGGAIVSINVDYGIAYLLFLDQPRTTTGSFASRQSFWVGLGASFTTIGSFLALSFSGFPILAEAGQFTALGTLFSFAFVHTVFPLIFRRMSPAKRDGIMPMEKLTTRLALSSGWKAFAVAALFVAAMAFLARPAVRADVQSMNSESAATRSAERDVQKTWGNVLSGATYVLIQGDTIDALQSRADRLETFIRAGEKSGTIKSGFSPASLFPGAALAQSNASAWRAFWTPQRVRALHREVARAAGRTGFARNAFAPFFQSIESPGRPDTTLPRELYSLLGISKSWKSNTWMMMSAVHPGPAYDPAVFFQELSADHIGMMLDAGWFTSRLSRLLFTMFVKMGILCGVGLVVVLIFYFMDVILVVLALLPVAFALVCTFATYRLLHMPLDIPSLLLVVVVFGMGSDYSIYFIGAYQRYFDERDPAMRPIRAAVFLNAGSTITGLGVLALSGHTMLRSAGLSMVLGLGYSLVGTVALLPPLLRLVYSEQGRRQRTTPRTARSGVTAPYRHMETYVRMFARFKVMFDPMFPGLAQFVGPQDKVLDIGCGYGVPAVWLMQRFPGVSFYGVDPDQDRVRVARRAWGDRGSVIQGQAPGFSLPHEQFDTVLMLDMIHYLPDNELLQTLASVSSSLRPGGSIVIRATVPSPKLVPWERWLEQFRLILRGQHAFFRTGERLKALVEQAGFIVVRSGGSASGREETWLVCSKK